MYETKISVLFFVCFFFTYRAITSGIILTDVVFFLFMFSEDEDNSSSTREPILSVFVGVTAVVTIAAVILGCIHMTKSNG